MKNIHGYYLGVPETLLNGDIKLNKITTPVTSEPNLMMKSGQLGFYCYRGGVMRCIINWHIFSMKWK